MSKIFIDDLKIVLRIFAIIPFIWIGSELLMILIGTIAVGHIPKYGVDPDPSSLNLIILNLSLMFGLMLNICVLPFWVLILLHLIINRVQFSRNEYFSFLSMVLGITVFLIHRVYHPKIMDWVTD
ncbi:MAG: hypothetical protein ACXWEY_01160 [Bacteroidia bacterium]